MMLRELPPFISPTRKYSV